MEKAALVTGGAKRIGRAIALSLHEMGYRVALHYNTAREEAEETAEVIRNRGGVCSLHQCDFVDTRNTEVLIEAAAARFPDLNLLINNSSIFSRAYLKETDTDELHEHLMVNCCSPLILLRDFGRICGRGSVINILDTKINQNHTPYFSYSLSKKALAAATRLAAKEFAPQRA